MGFNPPKSMTHILSSFLSIQRPGEHLGHTRERICSALIRHWRCAQGRKWSFGASKQVAKFLKWKEHYLYFEWVNSDQSPFPFISAFRIALKDFSFFGREHQGKVSSAPWSRKITDLLHKVFSSCADFGRFSDGPGGRNPRSSRQFQQGWRNQPYGWFAFSLSEMLIV